MEKHVDLEGNRVPVKSSRLGGRFYGPGYVRSYGVLIVFVLAFGLFFLYLVIRGGFQNKPSTNNVSNIPSEKIELLQFKDENDFRAYLQKSQSKNMYFSARNTAFEMESADLDLAAPQAMGGDEAVLQPSRISETNVQVRGIDEPDIVKTNGKEIFYSSEFYNVLRGVPEPIILPDVDFDEQIEPASPSQEIIPSSVTKVISAFPPDALNQSAGIQETGELLLVGNMLLVFSNSEVVGYSVSNPVSPERIWDFELEDDVQIVTSRLMDNKVYLVTRRYTNSASPCPVPFTQNGLSIPCRDIWYPSTPTNVDSTFSVVSLSPTSGEIENNLSFVGSANSSTVYMSQDNLYVTYSFSESIADFMVDIFLEVGEGILPSDVLDRIQEIDEYDITDNSKIQEITVVIEDYSNTLSKEEEDNVENELEQKGDEYLKKHARDLEKTGIVKIDVKSLVIEETGVVPGYVLNQFSLDEYDNHLRVATTTSGRNGYMGTIGESFNDVYILDNSLNTVGEIKDLGLTEQIYSARFIGDKGYLVTFRRIDPFYVLDLSDPTNPRRTGELKIPGFSSYLHPLTDNLILGVGEEQQNSQFLDSVSSPPDVGVEILPRFVGPQVKLSLFDVSNASNPSEKDKFLLDEGWSEVNSNHRAFLQDAKHWVFFVPAGTNGYVFSYENDSLTLVKKVTDIEAKRALFIEDYLYIIGEREIVVFNETTWEEVGRLQLQ